MRVAAHVLLAGTALLCASCDSGTPLDLCATLPVDRGEVPGTGMVHMLTDDAEAFAEHVRVEPGTHGALVKFCLPYRGKLTAAYLQWGRNPEVPLPAPISLFNTTQLDPVPRDTFHGSWKNCDADDCTEENGAIPFYSWNGWGGSRNRSGEITAWDLQAGRLAGWVKFDTELTTYCDENGNSPRGACDLVCTGFMYPCRIDIGKHIEVEVDITWTPQPDAGVGPVDGDGGV